MADQVKGGCLCGAVEFAADLPPRFVTHCHCGQCRRAHGAAFVTWAGFREEALHLGRGAAALRTFNSATGAQRAFCGLCGSPLFFRHPERWPGEVHLALAQLSEPHGLTGGAHFYVDHKAGWWEIADGLPRFGGATGGEPKA